MPHSDELKSRMVQEIVLSAVSILGYEQDAVCLAFDEIPPDDWEDLYHDEITTQPERLYKKSGYTM
ncbi:hypothetical protein [Stenotrophomonas sp. 3(2025)]|uniref:hypothetical protein n=1 Tax=Stenotrophomonas sp. 3(2025) TaxID=3456023 RepID=UPI004043F89D